MALGTLLNQFSSLITHDSYGVGSGNNTCQVVLDCKRKGRVVHAMLSAPLNIVGKSHWKNLFQGGIAGDIGAKVLDVADNAAQFLGGNSIRQPYFGRKYWCGTDPLHFTMVVQLLSFIDAYREVYLPMIDLLSMVFPRMGNSIDRGNILSFYHIPGPSLAYDARPDAVNDTGISNSGDVVSISLGNFISFRGCYINSISLDVANSFSTDGYPHNVKATIDFDTMDALFVESDLSFLCNGFTDASISTGKLIDDLQGGLRKVTDSISESLERSGVDGSISSLTQAAVGS